MSGVPHGGSLDFAVAERRPGRIGGRNEAVANVGVSV